MRVFARLAVAVAAVIPIGCATGFALGSYAQSGSFDQYRYPRVAAWQPEPPEEPPLLRASDLEYSGSGRQVAALGATE